MDFSEKTVKKEYIFKGEVINLRVDTVTTPSGNLATRELVEHPGGVCVVPLFDDGTIIMEWQYRRPFDSLVYEIPAGKRDKNEEPIVCAKRELEEEIGLCAKNWVYLGVSYASPGFCTEGLHLFLATDLYEGEMHRDPDEVLIIEKVPLSELVEKAMSGEIKDGNTIMVDCKNGKLQFLVK